jgi:site-specific recombinase XerD
MELNLGNGITLKVSTMKDLASFDAKAFVKSASEEQLTVMAQFYIFAQAQKAFDSMVKLAGIDYQKERQTFLDQAGYTASQHTKRGYNNALKKLEKYAEENGINLLELTAKQADDFIYSLTLKGNYSPATVRQTVSAASAFFTFLERRFSDTIRNPFRGTKARPKETKKRGLLLPNAEEIETIKSFLPSRLSAAVAVMAERGLRAGALPGLTLSRGHFTSHSKGKDIKGLIGEKAVKAIKEAGLDERKPFTGMTANDIEASVHYYTAKLAREGKIKAAYSCHDFRHFFARREYGKDKDVRRVQNLLGHSTIAITDRYIKILDMEAA